MKTTTTASLLGLLLLFSLTTLSLKAQDWQDTKQDLALAVDADSISKGKFTLIWINKDPAFPAALKTRMIDTYFATYPRQAKKYNKKTQKTVTFVIDPNYDGVAATAGTVVRYNPKWFEKNPGDIDVVTHEVMHIVQAYPDGSGPWWITEGIADYVRHTMGVDNAGANWALPEYKATQQFDNGYRVTARFFFWLEKNYKGKLLVKLDQAMRNKTYTEAFWQIQTGKTMQELWNLYSQNPQI